MKTTSPRIGSGAVPEMEPLKTDFLIMQIYAHM